MDPSEKEIPLPSENMVDEFIQVLETRKARERERDLTPGERKALQLLDWSMYKASDRVVTW